MQGRKELEKGKGQKKEGKKGESDYFRRGWLVGYDREKKRMQEQKKEELLKKEIHQEL